MSAPIRVLDDITASRIAAGEVVERPASVVKELVENSLDAGATEIRVEIQAGGRRMIRVTDNGHGIATDEVDLAFARHATSKIRSGDNLDDIATLGFRGEALASIAAVSHVTLVSRTADTPTAVQVRLDNGRIVSRAAVGAPVGTSVTAENLFHAVPARLKFLRNEATETGHVQDLVTCYALAYPARRFLLVRDGRTVFQSPGTAELEDTLIAAFGLDVARAMIPLTADAAPPPAVEPGGVPISVRVRGYVSPPHVHRATRRYITLFVNGRWVHDTQLGFALVQAYHTLLPKGRFPIAVVAIELAANAVDVNVHPAKTEVRFRDARAVFAAVARAVRTSVVGGAPVAPIADANPVSDLWRAPRGVDTHRRAATTPSGGRSTTQGTFLEHDGARLPLLRVVGQVAQAYIVAEGPDGLYLIDQHAAHERVMYEAFMARGGHGTGQRMLSPEPVALAPRQMGVVAERLTAFTDVGFDLEPFGRDAVLVRALPEVLVTTDAGAALRTILDLTAEGDTPVDEAFEARLVRAVCKQATIKAGQTLSSEEMRSLVRQLEDTASPRTCPHGRPTMIVLTAERVAREFGRA
jgi:DNA mismatch repair protein MutL